VIRGGNITGLSSGAGACVGRRDTRRPMVGGYTLLEVLVALTVLLLGVLPILFLVPQTLRSRKDAEFLTEAALLAQLKGEEIRRDDDTSGTLITTISKLAAPTAPIPFSQEERLSYSFCGQSLLYSTTDAPQGDANVARVIISRTPQAATSGLPPTTVNPRDVIYELRFGP
jgi:type II secretory pathway pseudopilin PulG